jgi:hypothetical protein
MVIAFYWMFNVKKNLKKRIFFQFQNRPKKIPPMIVIFHWISIQKKKKKEVNLFPISMYTQRKIPPMTIIFHGILNEEARKQILIVIHTI